MGARNGAFPKSFIPLNKNEVPQGSLMFTTLTVQFCLLLVWLKGEDYSALLMVSTSMILIPYLLIGAYLFKLSLTQKAAAKYRLIGAAATLYAAWIVYAAGTEYLLLSVLLYLPGVLLFLYSQKKHYGSCQFTVWKSRIGIAVDFGCAGRTAVCL